MSARTAAPATVAEQDIAARFRIGSVPYLNARPLVEGLGGLTFLVPSALAERFTAGALDAALLPVYEALRQDRATIVDDAAIACRGAVFSVFLAHREPLEDIPTIALDPASHTSNRLLQCLLAEFRGLTPEYVAAPLEDSQPRILIGDAAMRFRAANPGWRYLDLGEEWMRCTGLPFVFACWVVRQGVPASGELAAALREAKKFGLGARAAIAAEYANPEFVGRYLSEFIRYDLRDEEKQAIVRFSGLLRKHGLVDRPAAPVIDYI